MWEFKGRKCPKPSVVTSPTDEDEWLTAGPNRFRTVIYTAWKTGRFEEEINFLTLPGFETRIAEPKA
jgi:hypothetical protein